MISFSKLRIYYVQHVHVQRCEGPESECRQAWLFLHMKKMMRRLHGYGILD